MSTSSPSSDTPDFAGHGIITREIPTAAGVTVNGRQSLLIGSVLDLFAGQPSKRKLALWTDDAVFADPLTVAEGRQQYEAQWYGLKVAFSEIHRESCQVVSGGDPVEIDLRNRYKVKGLGSEQSIDSKVKVWMTQDQSRITRVEDRWNDNLPESGFKTAMRNLNSVIVPKMVSVPKSIEEEERQ